MSRVLALGLLGFFLLVGLVAWRFADTYIDRLPNHDGYYLVAVPDEIPAAELQPRLRPRHAVVVVVDGLRADRAAGMQSVRRLREAGQCHLTHVGPITVSRPVYAVLSTGLEQDRTGSRNNDETRPLHVESLWQVARQAGLRVTAVSEIPWFQQLFPDGFDDYHLVTHAEDELAGSESQIGGLALFHPGYVDDAGHDYGGVSSQYAAAVKRVDAELNRLLDRLDLHRDLVVLTADHGHTDRGGHGSPTPEVEQVLTCFAGHGIVASPKPGPLPPSPPLDNRIIAPALAVLLELRFPQNMRAGEDSLDSIWGLIDPGVYPASYLDNRRAAVQRFRKENRAAVGRWLGRSGPAEWSELYARARHRQLARAGLFLLGAILLGFFAYRRLFHTGPTGPRRPRRPTWFVGWAVGTVALQASIYIAACGSFDFNSMNSRPQFVKWSCIASLLAVVLALGAHALVFRDRAALAIDQARLAGLLLLLSLAHIVAFGWPLGFALPGRVVIFLPFIGNVLLLWEALSGCLLALTLALKPVKPTVYGSRSPRAADPSK